MLLDEMLTFYDPLVDTDMDCKCVILGMFHHSCVTVGYEYTEHLQSEDGSDGGGGIDNVPQTPKAGGIGIANVASKQPQAQKGKGASAGNAEVRGRGRGGGGRGRWSAQDASDRQTRKRKETPQYTFSSAPSSSASSPSSSDNE